MGPLSTSWPGDPVRAQLSARNLYPGLITWLAGEPNNFELSTRTTYIDQGQGEDAVGISFNNNNGVGGWNDEHPYGTAGTGVYGYFVRHNDLFPELRRAQP